MKNIFKILLVLFILFLLFTNREILIYSTLQSFDLFNKAIFPSIFPIMMLKLLVSSEKILRTRRIMGR